MSSWWDDAPGTENDSWWKMSPRAGQPSAADLGFDASAAMTSGAAPGRFALSQLPQGFNEALYQTVMSPFNAWDWITRSTGILPKDTVPLSEKLRSGGPVFGYTPQHEPETKAERILNDVGQAAGTVASTVVPIAGALGAAA